MHDTAIKLPVENLIARPHISVYIATSMDGLIAKENDGLDWLENINPLGCHEDYGFNEFLSSIDTMIMGRGTYKIASSVEDWPYKGKRVVRYKPGYVLLPPISQKTNLFC